MGYLHEGHKSLMGINRIIMEFKCECDPHGRKEPSGINRIIMEFKSFIRVLFPELFKAELIES